MKAWPSILIRCDAGRDHGLGHLMRCLTLAESLRAQGAMNIKFMVQASSRILQRIYDSGFSVLDARFVTGTKESCAEILDWNHQNCQNDPIRPWIVIDGKYASPSSVEPLSHIANVICFDDFPYRDFPVPVIVNAQPWTTELDYPPHADRQILSGGRFNSIHPRYFEAAKIENRQAILITMGGEDPQNDTAWIANSLGDMLTGYPVIVAIGPSHPDQLEAVNAINQHIPQAEILYAPSSLTLAAERSFLAISAGGTSCYELQAAGIAVAALAVEHHQLEFINALERLGGIVSIGGPQKSSDERDSGPARRIVQRFLYHSAWREERIERGKAMFPAPGGPYLAQRLADILLK